MPAGHGDFLGNQDRIFARQGESDRYWQRNRDHIMDLELREDLPLRLIDMYGIWPQSVMEVGAANGYRLNWISYLNPKCRTHCVAVEPSAAAIVEGKKLNPGIEFVQATAAEMTLTEVFDLVIVNYVLHWVDRRCFLQSVANIDKAVREGGYLIVGDFAPANRHKVPYHHHPGMYTYKQDYARLFEESGLYHVVATLTTGHRSRGLDPDVPEQERYGVTLLRKDTSAHYAEVDLSKGARLDG